MIIIFGFILGYLIIKLYYLKLQDYHGPNSNNIKKFIYKFNSKYYKFSTIICPCRLL